MIVLIGMAGSGKSTQRELLRQKLGCESISTGDVLRAQLTGPDRQDLLAGKIVDDRVTIKLLEAEFKAKKVDERECLLDGSPRSLYQAEWLVKKIKAGEVKLTAIIHLRLNKQIAKRRLLKRGRSDDTEAAIDQRFKEMYEDTILPILTYLRSQGITVHDVDADGNQQEVEQRIETILKASA